jgi:hypothetical protein
MVLELGLWFSMQQAVLKRYKYLHVISSSDTSHVDVNFSGLNTGSKS